MVMQSMMDKKEILPEYSQFNVGDVFFGTISSLRDSKEFCVVKNDLIEEIQLTCDLVEMFWIPAMSETFLIKSDEGIFRVARVPLVDLSKDATKFMELYLMDTGESFTMRITEIPDNSFFEMPEKAKKVRGLAISCVMNEVELEHDFKSDLEFLANSLYKKFTFEVVEVEEFSVKVTILPFDDAPVNENDLESENSMTDENEEVDLTPLMSTAITKESLTTKQLELLYEEPLNTNNAQIAVQGFVTKDDNRLCKFYDPEIGGCFKGGRCKLRHELEIKDGTCRDRKEIHFLDIPKAYPLPALHSTVRIEITHFHSVSKFICRYTKLKNASSDSTTVLNHMNKDDEVKNYKQLTEWPAWKQLVVVKSNDLFHRGRIELLLDLHQMADVLFVDLGRIEKIHFKNLFVWEPRFNYFSFQAIEMEIANVQPLPDNSSDEDAIEIILKHQRKCRGALKAVIFENVMAIKCKLLNSDGDDIGEELVSLGLVKEKEIDRPTKEVCGEFLPG